MQVRERNPQDTDWPQVIVDCRGHALHLPAVHSVHGGGEGLRLLQFDDGGIPAGCAVAFLSQAKKLGLPLGPRSLVLPTAPALVDANLGQALRAALLDYARDQRCERLVIQAPSSGWLTDDDDLASFRTGAIVEFVLQLDNDPEAVLAGMSKIHRKNVRRAGRQELRVEEDSSLQGLLALREMQLASATRASEKTEGFAVSEEEFFRTLHRSVYADGPGHVLFAYHGDTPVAALAWLTLGDRAVTVRSGSIPAGYELRAMYLLHDALIRRCIDEGVGELNIGGVPMEASEKAHPQAGLFEFKQGFGGEAKTRYGVDLPLKEIHT